MLTGRQMNSIIFHGTSVTAFDQNLRENARALKLRAAAQKREADRQARIAATLAFARAQNSGFRRA